MYDVPPCYYKSQILRLIDSYIDEGYTSYSVLSSTDKDRLTAECMDALGDDAYSCIIDSAELDKTLQLLKKYVLSGNKEDAYSLASTLRENANDYFDEEMNCLFEERINRNEYVNNVDHGFFPFVDQVDGSIEWRKSA